ncbi:MAG TPA: pyridoxal-phosphate dependent enzyme [Acidimicrobiia bacterium]|jgi:cysteine synthase|nr:pyridoxal-phosphate dependent enzyme [Acidimicrobiia bacterium]HIL45956.1 pyridoxal-phosphate dependent enzyme [Acidimicrobiia bacterium]
MPNGDLNAFTGKHAVQDFMNPGKLAYLPLVELPEHLNPMASDGVRIMAKLMTFTPLHNVKAIPAFNMMAAAAQRGELAGVETIIENSSGNTVTALAVSARQFGIEQTKAIVPSEASWQKIQMLQFFGITPIVNQEPADPDEADERSGIYKAKEMGSQEGWMNPGQYTNPDNPEAHYQWIGRQIWEQTSQAITVLCGSLGTTGTMIGNSRYLKEANEAIQVVGVKRAPDNYVPGPRTELLLRLIGFDWPPHLDSQQVATTKDSYRSSMELSRNGIYVGPSSGLSLVGLVAYLDQQQQAGTLDQLRNENGEVVCVFMCPDTPLPYFEEYFRYLAAEDFPEIVNQELLENLPSDQPQ